MGIKWVWEKKSLSPPIQFHEDWRRKWLLAIGHVFYSGKSEKTIMGVSFFKKIGKNLNLDQWDGDIWILIINIFQISPLVNKSISEPIEAFSAQ